MFQRYFLALLISGWALASLLAGCSADSQPTTQPPAPHTAQAAVQPYPAAFGYGCNLGYYGPPWSDEQLAHAVAAAGGTTIRVTLPEQFLAQWGPAARVPAFRYYADSLHLRDLVCFVGEPAPAHRDATTYPGCREPSKLFANLYEPIWRADGTINPQNYYAQYIYQLIKQYGQTIRVWEVVNEPDYITDTSNKEWLGRAPEPAELPNLRAPIYRYIRTLRITWEVVKRYQPTAYVTPGGLGYAEYLDALLRYTDNPHAGEASAEYPATGGAYFDVLDYHVYPSYYLRHRSWRSFGRLAYLRNSDTAAEQVLGHKNDMDAVLRRYGYDGTTYPRKHFIVTETNISRRPADWRAGSDEMQRNFGIKALVLAQQQGLRQLHFYQVGEAAPAPPGGVPVSGEEEFKLMGLYENLNRDVPGHQRPTELGRAVRTTAYVLRGLAYDAAATAALHLPRAVGGGAFSGGGRTAYVLWAKVQGDQREVAAARYSFPAGSGVGRVAHYAWNYRPGVDKPVSRPAQNLALSGSPDFFEAVASEKSSAK
ncbi:MAG: hypothetical protein EOO56_00180 [Hymenobacter sp.]|nr:MAG: hypothetical protein EOO56_00180 [Hymenobacter sp.]